MRIQNKYVMAVAVLSMLGALAGTAGASMITTATWAVDGISDGVGVGVLNGISLAYSSPLYGISTQGGNYWNTGLGTAPACGGAGGCSDTSAAFFGADGAAAAQQITFGATIVNPILFVSYGHGGSSLNFGSLSLTMLSSNNASLSGDVVTFTASPGNTVDDGFAVRINGTFGPSTPLNFTETSFQTNSVYQLDGMAFTLGEVPEPASLGLAFAGVVGMWFYRRRVTR
jgi:hypothetical protein